MLNELAAAERGARVVALGGGAVTTDDVREALRRLPHVVWLDAPRHVLFAPRPVGHAAAGARRGPFEALYARRRPLYDEVSTAVVRTAGRERLAWVVDKVVAAVAA